MSIDKRIGLPGFYLQSEPPVRGGLGSENTFEQCVSEMALAGFTGSEVGNKYPKNPEVLKKGFKPERNRDLQSVVFFSPFDKTFCRSGTHDGTYRPGICKPSV